MDFLKMMSKAKEMQTRMASMQDELAEIEVAGQSGGGLVSVVINGKGMFKSIKIDPSLLKLKVKDLDGDRCVLEVQLPVDAEVLAELYRFDVSFVRVDGKWIPEWLAENWSDLIGEARDVLADILPFERAEDNFGFVDSCFGCRRRRKALCFLIGAD